MQKVLFLLLFTGFSNLGFSNPEKEENPVIPLNVTVIQDARIEWLLEAHKQLIISDKGIPGFRIQVGVESGNQSRLRIQRKKYEFDAQYPGVNSYIDYDAPYYKLRVGDFRTRLDARRFLHVIRRQYSNAFIVVDRINFPEL
jgi:hypothetical protein